MVGLEASVPCQVSSPLSHIAQNPDGNLRNSESHTACPCSVEAFSGAIHSGSSPSIVKVPTRGEDHAYPGAGRSFHRAPILSLLRMTFPHATPQRWLLPVASQNGSIGRRYSLIHHLPSHKIWMQRCRLGCKIPLVRSPGI